jgi:hypothetical protein
MVMNSIKYAVSNCYSLEFTANDAIRGTNVLCEKTVCSLL